MLEAAQSKKTLPKFSSSTLMHTSTSQSSENSSYENFFNTFQNFSKQLQDTVSSTKQKLEGYIRPEYIDLESDENDPSTVLPATQKKESQEESSMNLHPDLNTSQSTLFSFQEYNKPTESVSITVNDHSPTSPEPQNETDLFSSFSDGFKGFFDNVKNQAQDQVNYLKSQFYEDEEEDIQEVDDSYLGSIQRELNGMITLSPKQKFYGFLMSLCTGIFCLLISLALLPSLLFAMKQFGFFYSLGNFFCLLSTLFLSGPVGQIQNMMKPERAIPSTVFLSSLFLTLITVFVFHYAALVVVFVVIQFIAFAWYILTYIPLGQKIVSFVFNSFMSLFN